MSDDPVPTPDQLRRYAEHFNRSASLKFMGVKLSFPTSEQVQVDLEIRPEHRGGMGTEAVNGGVLAAMFDLAIGCTPALVEPTRRSATIQLSMSFLKPVRGDRLRAIARIDRAGAGVLFSSATLFDAHGEVCARCQGVMHLSRLRWASGVSPAIDQRSEPGR
ncbi:MAG: PaaI family thioesterase [Myxococcales bacterium]|nr:PaaI family thioesterase [Myxococcales bacterium]